MNYPIIQPAQHPIIQPAQHVSAPIPSVVEDVAQNTIRMSINNEGRLVGRVDPKIYIDNLPGIPVQNCAYNLNRFDILIPPYAFPIKVVNSISVEKIFRSVKEKLDRSLTFSEAKALVNDIMNPPNFAKYHIKKSIVDKPSTHFLSSDLYLSIMLKCDPYTVFSLAATCREAHYALMRNYAILREHFCTITQDRVVIPRVFIYGLNGGPGNYFWVKSRRPTNNDVVIIDIHRSGWGIINSPYTISYTGSEMTIFHNDLSQTFGDWSGTNGRRDDRGRIMHVKTKSEYRYGLYYMKAVFGNATVSCFPSMGKKFIVNQILQGTNSHIFVSSEHKRTIDGEPIPNIRYLFGNRPIATLDMKGRIDQYIHSNMSVTRDYSEFAYGCDMRDHPSKRSLAIIWLGRYISYHLYNGRVYKYGVYGQQSFGPQTAPILPFDALATRMI